MLALLQAIQANHKAEHNVSIIGLNYQCEVLDLLEILIQHLVIVVVALNQKGLGWKLSIVAGMIGMASQA